ncbi:uncharacterized protein JCM15063_000225 [Sporobolomyces koalae]|uniref:uncharacterized protein n=1 Tax=Sporobolomyces koalae TaxID=500713 RepID=UPI00316F1132
MAPPHDLLHDALNRATSRSRTAGSPPALEHLKLEDELIDVATPAPSSPASSVASTPAGSRSSSPSRNKRGGAGKPRRDKTKERQKAEANKNPLDPINRFPGEVNGRIFGELQTTDLLACGLVCKRWRRSQTLNYTWYLLLQSLTWTSPEERKATYAESNGLPKWRASDAKEDWAEHFANIMRRDDLESKEADVDEDGLTMKEERELKWAQENEENEFAGMDKVAMRAYYKSLGNKKVKGKSFKGSIRTHEGDGLGDIAHDDI